MKHYIKTILAACTVVASAQALTAQNTYSGYFLEDYTPRFEMNPAFGSSDKGFVSFPALGNMNIDIHGNLHARDIFYNLNGETVLFTNPGINAKDAMSKFSNHNKIGAGVRVDIINVGFKGLGGFNTVGLSARANLNASVPKSMFSLVKEGVSNQTYSITDMRAQATAFAQIALNHSHDLNKVLPGLRVGGTVKFLIGMGNVDAYFRKAELNLGENSWTALTNADIYASVKGLTYDTKLSKRTGNYYVSGADLDGYGPNGFGMAFDLGAEYKWGDFRFSAALLDLGFLSSGHTMYATTGGDKTLDTDAYAFAIGDKEDPNWDNFRDDLAKLYELEDRGDIGSRTRALSTTLNLAAEYEFPLYRPLHFGLVNTTCINGLFTYTDFRLSANVKPCKVFSASANMGMGTYGVGFGWLLNVHTKGFNFFLGMDQTLGKLAKQGLPLNSNAEVNLGINFPF